MRVFRSLTEAASSAFSPATITIGNFDGVHLGHAELFRRVVQLAASQHARPSVLTFDPHPTHVVAPERAPKLLMPIADRLAAIGKLGIEQVLILPFNGDTARLTPAEFFHDILLKGLGVTGVVVGDNFHFGHKQSGNIVTLSDLGRAHNIEIQIAPALYCRGILVSSSEVRRLVRHGAVTQAERMLGRPFAVTGPVVKGAGRGSRQTVPTLNIDALNEILPAHGVYVTRTIDLANGRRWHSVTNVGIRPTFGEDHLTIETFLLGEFDGRTPESIQVDFLFRLREERQFESAEALKSQILRDVARAQKWFRRYRRFVKKRGAGTTPLSAEPVPLPRP